MLKIYIDALMITIGHWRFLPLSQPQHNYLLCLCFVQLLHNQKSVVLSLLKIEQF